MTSSLFYILFTMQEKKVYTFLFMLGRQQATSKLQLLFTAI